ncbi:hypothetical protein BG011_002927 [Mortierella polycephala]|uniref:Uncharacterized protein n=1 Tax=Mortierella polycephala TaxID=41804 RepID=A0A9P6QGP2_9FUNG|nr:hypothetical protein BG011_002927 [Mortierella polycephala]
MAAPPPVSTGSTSKGSFSVSDILERYQDANKEFIMSVLNAKSKEDERRAEEERYKTEQVKLQSKKLELELAMERRRGSPPAARSYPSQASESTSNYYGNGSVSNNNSNNNGSYSQYTSDGSRSRPSSSKHVHHDHIVHTKESQDRSSSAHQGSQHSHMDHHPLPSPQSRPPFLKINTSVRQYHPQSHSSQRLPPSPHSTLPPLPSTAPLPKSSGRPYGLQSLATSAQSSPVAVIDYQSHIPPPLTPKDDHVSPTSALSPTQGHNMKRKSVNHDAVMDAVRAKVMRNAAGQQLQQQQKRSAAESEREQANSNHGHIRRKTQHATTSPDIPRKNIDALLSVASVSSSETRQDDTREGKAENTLKSASPPSPTNGNMENNGTGGNRSRSSSPFSGSIAKSRRPIAMPKQSQAVHADPKIKEEVIVQ